MKTTRISARNKNYWLEKGYSDEESTTLARSRMPGTPEYFLLFKNTAKTQEEAEKMSIDWSSRKALTLENMTRKYGPVDGPIRFQSYCDKQAYSNTLKYMVEKYGELAGIEKYYTANKKRAVTRENLVRKHGEVKGNAIYDDYVAKQRINGKTLEYFIGLHGPEEGKRIYDDLGVRKSCSFASFLQKCDGDFEEATKQHLKYWEHRAPSPKTVSRSSQAFFKKIHERLSALGINDIYYADFNSEFGINIIGKRYVFIDFFVRSKGKAIEYYGNYYHANPKFYPTGTRLRMFGGEKVVDVIWKTDQDRIDDIKSHPHVKDVLIVWEDDVDTNEETILAQCIKYILT